MAKKRYRVVGESIVAGHEPGEEFSDDLEEAGINVPALIEGGHLQELSAKPDKSKEE